MITQEQIDAAWEVHGGGDAYEAFANGMRCGSDLEREECALACEAIETHKWALYKGRAPYTGREPGRASDYTQGESGGAGECAAVIRARGATDGKQT